MLKKNGGISCRYMLMWPMFEKLSQTSGLSIIILIHIDVLQTLEDLWHKSYYIIAIQTQNGSSFCKQRRST